MQGMTGYKFSRKRLYEYIASASTPVSKKELLRFFRPGDKLAEQVNRGLEFLQSRGRIARDSGQKKFYATQPYADIMYATVTRNKADNSHGLNIWGKPKNSTFRASLSSRQVQKNKLRTGDVVLVKIINGKGLNRNAKVLKKCAADKPAHLQGYFNKNADGSARFQAADNSIKTQFRLQNPDPGFELEHRGVYEAAIPMDMRIDAPEVIIKKDNGIDLSSGADINRVLLRKHGVPYRYSAAATVESATLTKRPFSKARRNDESKRGFVTIDPEGAEDLDDACAVEKLAGGWRLSVAVADIDEFVTAGTALDHESYLRGNTIYLPEGNFGLYPHELTMRCSLLHNQERPVGIYEAFFDHKGNLLSESTGFAYIRTKAQLTYDDYQDRINQNDPDIRIMNEFHQVLKEKFNQSREGLHITDQILNNDDEGYVGHGFVETAMVIANQGIARELHEAGLSVPFRNHSPAAHPQIYKKMAAELRYLGFDITDNPHECNWAMLDDILKQAQARGIETRVAEVLRNDFFNRSFYEPHSAGHFALGAKHYCHATSPLRRKPDSYIWRGLRRLKGIKKGALTDREIENMPEICDHLQRKNRVANDIASDRNKWHLIKTLKAGEERPATILHINKDSVEIMLKNGLRNRLSEEMLKVAGWNIDAQNRQIVRTSHGQEERISRDQKLRGRIESVKPLQGLWDFEPEPMP